MQSRESSLGFQQYWLILRRRWLPASVVFGSVFVLSALVLSLRKPVYEAEGKLLFNKESTTPSLTGLGREIGQLSPLQAQNTPLDTEAEIIRSAPITQNTINKLKLKDKRGEPLSIKQFLKQLRVTKIRGTDVLEVTYKDIDPRMAAAVVNTIMAIYLEDNIVNNRSKATSAQEFIEQQLPTAEASVRQAEVALRQFKEKNRVVALDEEAKSAVAVIADLQRQINSAQAGVADAKALSASLQKNLNRNLQEATAVTSISQSPEVQDVLRQVQQIESVLATERSRFRENNPTIGALKSKKADLENLLKERLQGVVQANSRNSPQNLQISQFEQNLTNQIVQAEARRLGLASQVAALTRLQDTYRQRMNALPNLEQKQRELERKLQASQSTYTLLLQKLEEVRIAANQRVGNASVVAYALVPNEPVSPPQLLYMTAALLGLIAAVATMYLLEKKDKSLKTVDEVKRLFGFSVLGVIPLFDKVEKSSPSYQEFPRSIPDIVVRDFPRSSSSAAYWMLQSSVQFLASNRELSVIVVTSSVPKEGKSTVAANLAFTIASGGRRVLLVDADMHCPLQHHIWSLPNDSGLSNVLGEERELRTAVKQVTTNLDVLTSGLMPLNPVALIASQQMASLISLFSSSYDLTIIDTPPLSVNADAAILGKAADGVLLVVQPGLVDSASATLAKEILLQSGQNVLGVVANGVVAENKPYGYYYSSSKENYTGESATTPLASKGQESKGRQ